MVEFGLGTYKEVVSFTYFVVLHVMIDDFVLRRKILKEIFWSKVKPENLE